MFEEFRLDSQVSNMHISPEAVLVVRQMDRGVNGKILCERLVADASQMPFAQELSRMSDLPRWHRPSWLYGLGSGHQQTGL